MNSVWIEALLIFSSYWIAIMVFKNRLERRRISVFGPIMLIRTDRGLNFIDFLSRPKTLWRFLGDFGIVIVVIGMVYMISIVLMLDYVMMTSPPKPSPLTNPRNVLLIPGLNEFIPFLWGLIGLIVTLIVHEFSHAVLSRVEGVRVKSLGVILALVPIGGFAEPDEKELMKKEKRSRMRIYSAGITANFLTALIAFSIFFSLLSFLKPHVIVVKSFSESFGEGDVILSINGIQVEDREDILKAVKIDSVSVVLREKDGDLKFLKLKPLLGVYVLDTINDTPAYNAGLKECVILSVNGFETPNVEVFKEFMEKTKPNETLTLKVLEDGKLKVYRVRLAEMNGHGFLGVLIGGDYFSGAVIGYSKDLINSLKPSGIQGILYLTAMPFYFTSFDGITNYFTPKSFFSNLGNIIFYMLNTFYWIAWLNFYIGLFNCLPAIPLDGGRLLNDLLKHFMDEKKVNTISRSLALFVFFSIFLSIILPNLALP